MEATQLFLNQLYYTINGQLTYMEPHRNGWLQGHLCELWEL